MKQPTIPFERYVDDVVAHCDTEEHGRNLRADIADRLGALGLELHPEKRPVLDAIDDQRPT